MQKILLTCLSFIPLMWPAMLNCRVFEEKCSIRLYVSTTFGQTITSIHAILINRATSTVYERSGDKIIFEDLPRGIYDLEVQAPNFKSRSERIQVSKKEMFLRIGLIPSPRHSIEESVIEGEIANFPVNAGESWVRLVALYANDWISDRISTSGKFRFEAIDPGRYVLLVFIEDKLVSTREFEYFGGALKVKISLQSLLSKTR